MDIDVDAEARFRCREVALDAIHGRPLHERDEARRGIDSGRSAADGLRQHILGDDDRGVALEAGLESFPGCAVVISHDRWFLDRIATHVLAFEGDSQVRWFEGNFSEYEEYKKRELGENIEQPHRIKYKKLA